MNTMLILKTKLIIILLLSTSLAFSQKPGESFIGKCEYIHFVNDTIVNFTTTSSYSGPLAELKSGKGIYKIENNDLTITVIDKLNPSEYERYGLNKNSCGEIKEMAKETIKYNIVEISNDSIKLIGPILENYQKLNKKRFLKGFLNWPWRWSFKKQHWYDPRERILTKSKELSAAKTQHRQ